VKYPKLTAAGAAVAIAALAGCGSASTPGSSSSGPTTLEVWLMSGSAPAAVVTSWNNDFQQQNPGVTVHVDIQQWTGIVQKTETALAKANTTPDVLEMGNTYVASFASVGGLLDLSHVSFPNQSSWLASLKAAGTYNGKLYGVPYYAGDRICQYRESMFSAAGITSTPTTQAQFVTDLQALKAKGYGPLEIEGENWYVMFSWLADAYGTSQGASNFIATQSGGNWTANFSSSQDQQALTWINNLFTSGLDVAAPDGNGTGEQAVFEAGKAAIICEPGWDVGVTEADFTKAGNTSAASDIGVFDIPGASGPAPVFLGGSNLGVGVHSAHATLAEKYIQLVTGTQYMSEMATVGGVIPNTTTLLGLQAANPVLNTANQAATNSWFTPNTPKEATLESQNVYTDLLGSIFSGQASVSTAASTADSAAESILNG
jgi:N,N'-diacetylchitobiose transport system substrate-binding protein